ncbi:hypothetical protein A8L34_05425 [Bacillus sp. FJAT-27264]|uniref:hypothetical protein n=1 Tax=Paenibacillus sp. (strain DSM 101736 / FJAT-27264) TaxID=1850362 RepID=UPI000807A3E8|nr:hypothetical protein [Bacillus sp. FJAT-27264]OBZ18986.1 hypothetical protein A8L34_05425 [Bacillus sp. FJAT-27264]
MPGLGRLLLGLIIIVTLGGCSSALGTKAEVITGPEGPTFSLMVGGKELADSTERLLSGTYRKGITILELLQGSGIAVFAEDGQKLLTVSNVSLGPAMEWEVQMDGKVISNTNWKSSPVSSSARIVIMAKSDAGGKDPDSVILYVNGGSEQETLTHMYVMSFTSDLSVRSLLKSCGMVQLSEDNQRIRAVKGYAPLTSEIWNLRVNSKKLLDNGMDMKLRPMDELEISLGFRY